MDDSTLTFDALNQVITSAVEDGKVLDLGVPIHRTNATPLDLSSIILLNEQIYADEAAFREAARKAIESGGNKTWYPGQQLTVIGRVGDESSSVGHVLSFILQPKDHSYTDFSITNEETPVEVNETNHKTIAQELVYKPYVDSIGADLQTYIDSIETDLQKLRRELGDLTSITNFIGIFEDLPNENTHPDYVPEPGDIIIVQRDGEEDGSTNMIYQGKNGMEYLYTSDGAWVELGFGSNIIKFICGTSGLKLPEKLFKVVDTKNMSLLSFIQYADEHLAETIGILEANTGTLGSRKLVIPIEIFGNTKYGLTLLKYIQESDKALAEFIRGNAEDNTLSLPKELLNSAAASITNPSTLLEFIQAADAQLDSKIKEDSYITLQEEDNTNYSILKITKRGDSTTNVKFN